MRAQTQSSKYLLSCCISVFTHWFSSCKIICWSGSIIACIYWIAHLPRWLILSNIHTHRPHRWTGHHCSLEHLNTSNPACPWWTSSLLIILLLLQHPQLPKTQTRSWHLPASSLSMVSFSQPQGTVYSSSETPPSCSFVPWCSPPPSLACILPSHRVRSCSPQFMLCAAATVLFLKPRGDCVTCLLKPLSGSLPQDKDKSQGLS